jgi:O-antigen ligase
MTFWTWQIPFVLLGVALVIPMVLRKPATAVYVLIGAAVVIEILPLRFSDSLTDTIPFFLNLNITAQMPVSITPAEIVMVVALVAWATASRKFAQQRPSGRILRPYVAFMLVVLMAEGWGLLNGGDFNRSLWEIRPQVYGFLLFVLTTSLIRERRQVIILASVFLLAAAFKAGVGYYRYFVTWHQVLGSAEAILAHEDSYFLLMFIVAAVAAAIWLRRRGIVLALLAASPIVAVVMLENRRRVGMLALIAALFVIVALAIRFEPRLRSRVIVVTAIVSALFAIFLAVEWNVPSEGLVGQVVRPLRSTLTGQADQRDYLSNLYRINENADIIATYQTSPVIGVGFGLPMLVVFPLADISQQDPLWDYIPHNSILWVGMRMGIVGMAVFWALVAMIVLEGIRALGSQEDSLLRGVAAFALAAVVAELVVAYGDVQLENFRNMIFFGVMVGIIEALPQIRAETVEEAARELAWASVPALSTSSHRRL